MRRIKIWNDKPSRKQLQEVAQVIDNGGVILMPTDTMYAIACDALSPKAIDRLCKAKGIDPSKQPLSIICSDISMAAEYAKIQNESFQLMKENVPGPFTFLLPAASSLPKAFKGRKVGGIRIPDNNFARQLAEYTGHAILSTSIKYVDPYYAVRPDLIDESYDGQLALMVEGEEGTTEVSTIVYCLASPPEIIRQGKGLL